MRFPSVRSFMRVAVEQLRLRRTDDVDLEGGATGLDLFRRLGLAPDAHLLVRGDTPIPLDEPLREGDRLLVVPVVSGGGAALTVPSLAR